MVTRTSVSVALAAILVLTVSACSDSTEASGPAEPGSGQEATDAQPGAPDIGDPYFPGTGNGGYDVEHYHIALSYDPAGTDIAAETTITATATQDLSRFNLDLHELAVESVEVDGIEAQWQHENDELVVTPGDAVADEQSFETTISYLGTPETLVDPFLPSGDDSSLALGLGWNRLADGSTFVVSEPDGARTWFPSNDHPSDKATFTFEVTVPEDIEVAANGSLDSTDRNADGTETWTWEMDEPMATYLATVATGQYEIEAYTTSAGVNLRNFFPPDLAAAARHDFGRTGEMIDAFTPMFGPYPYDEYGVVVVPMVTASALETQTMSVFGSDFVSGDRLDEVVVAHELAHQWFGDSVTPAAWQDIWLNEGFATYAEFLWLDHVDPEFDLDTTMAQLQGVEDLGPIGDPGADGLFDRSVYIRGAVTVHALRKTIGEEAFFDLLTTWTDEYRDGNASTADFIDLAEQISGAQLDRFFRTWLYDESMPAPGPP